MAFALSPHPSVAAALVGFAVVLLAGAGCGMALLRLLCADTEAPAEWFVMGAAMGLGLLSYAVLAVGLLGWLHPRVLLALVLIEAMLGAPSLAAWARSLTGRGRPGDHPPAQRLPRYAAAALLLFCAFLVFVTLVGALAPPNGDDWDSLSYHLAAPKIYLAHGRIAWIPYDSHTDFPFTMEMLYALGLTFGGAAGAKLFHWAAGWLTALAIAAFCRRLFPARGAGVVMPVWAPPLAAALFLSIPQVQWQATTAYIDLGTTLYQFLALVAFIYAVSGAGPSGEPVNTEARRHGGAASGGATAENPGAEGTEHTRRGQPPTAEPLPALSVSPRLRVHPSAGSCALGWLLVSGLMSGWAMGTKMTALLPFGLLVLAALLWAGMPERPKAETQERLNRWWGVGAFAAAGVLVACPWYVKSYLWTHNPVYPFFYSLFPHSVQWNREAEIAYQHEQHFFGLGTDVRALLMAPWNLAMQGWAYFTVPTRHAPAGTLPYFDGLRRGGLSATFLGLVPLALYTRHWDRRLTGLVVYALALLLPWFVLSQQSRYLLPITAALAVVAVAVVANLAADLPRWAASAFVTLVLLLHGRWGWTRILQPVWPVVSGQETRADYLQHAFPPYAAMQYINSLPAGTKVAMYQETRGFYLNRDYLWANPLQNTLIPYDRLPNGAALVQFLRTRLGVTHVLINTAGVAGSENTAWYRLLKDAIDRDDMVPVFDAHGVAVYALAGSR